MPVTQRLTLPDQTGADWKEPLKFLLQTPKKQDGNIRITWDSHSGNVDNLELLIGWESSQAQQAFQNSPDFGTTMSQLKPILSGEPTHSFVQFALRTKEVIVQVITVPASQEAALQSTSESYKSVTGWTGGTSGLSLQKSREREAKCTLQ